MWDDDDEECEFDPSPRALHKPEGQWCEDCGSHMDALGQCPECDVEGEPTELDEWQDYDPDC